MKREDKRRIDALNLQLMLKYIYAITKQITKFMQQCRS